MRSLTTRTIAILTIGVAVASAAGCGTSHDAHEPTARAPVPVTTAQAALVNVAERLEAGGVVTSTQSAAVSSRIVAPIAAVHVETGDRVRAGDVLVTLDAADIGDRARQANAAVIAAERALAQARAAQAAADADHRLGMAWHTRISSLHSRNSATAQERDEADARLASAVARLAGAGAGVEMAEANVAAARAAAGAAATTVSFTTLRAPFAGLITERLMDPGNLASPGVPLLRLESAGDRRVEVTVDEARATLIRVGDRVEVLVEGADETAEASATEGTVAEIARAIDIDRRAFIVKVALPGPERSRTGTFARVRFRGAERRALLIPASAVRRNGQVSSVFIVADRVARLRLIQIGEERREGVIVLTGLEPGETVVTSPPAQVVDGQPVETETGVRR